MKPVARISHEGALAVTVKPLTNGQVSLIKDILLATPSTGLGLSLRAAGSGREAIITGTPEGLRRLPGLLSSHRPQAGEISATIQSLLDNYFRSDYKIRCKDKLLELGTRTHIMGILNITPDSFSDGGLYADAERALAHAREMASQGADIIDIGGESTRPGAEAVPEDEEIRRVVPVIERLSKEISVPISIDTYKSNVANRALKAGASIVNDISGLRFSPDMAKVIADHGAAVVIMHIKGTPRDMQANPVYEDVVAEVMDYLEEGIGLAVKAGVGRDRILVDPGIGFGKTVEHNLILINRLSEFRALGMPIVLGSSRKRFIGTVLGVQDPAKRLEGTAATVAIGIERGARVIRVHDVAHMAKVAMMTDAVVSQTGKSNHWQRR